MPRLLLILLVTALPALAIDQAVRDQVTVLFNRRAWAEAQAVLEQVTVAEPANAQGWALLGQTFLARNDPEHAVPALEKATQLDPGNSGHFVALGSAYGLSAMKAGLLAKLGLANKCKAAYERAVELDPANISARWSLMEFSRQAPGFLGGGMAAAYAQAEAITRLDPRRGRAAYAGLYLAEQKSGEAFALYDEVLRTQPDDDDALFNLGRIAARTGEQLDRGLAALRQLTSREDHAADARVHALIGNILEKQGDPAGAKTAYATALSADPTNTRLLESLRKLERN